MCDFHDATDERALHVVARQGVEDGVRVWVGSAGLAAAMVPALVEKGLHFAGHAEDDDKSEGEWHEGNPVVVVAGSVHPVTVAQVAATTSVGVAHLAIDPRRLETWPSAATLDGALAGDDRPVHSTHPSAVGPYSHTFPRQSGETSLSRTTLIISTHAHLPDGAPPETWTAGAVSFLDRVADALARRLTSGAKFALVVTGGETAQLLFARLGASAIDVTGEVLPGIPTGRLDVGGHVVPIVTKSGGFGTDLDLMSIITGTAQTRA